MYKRIIVKIGTSVITKKNGELDLKTLKNLVKETSQLRKKNTEVVIVTSGAVGTGRGLVILKDGRNSVVGKQVFAAVGQIKLMETYAKYFAKEGIVCAQVLATKEDFRDRQHYLHMKNCMENLLRNDVVPVINENDVVAVAELVFTDNDELAGLLASQLSADAVIILTGVDGVYDAHGRVIENIAVSDINSFEKFITTEKSGFGRGGMLTKFGVAKKLAMQGIATHIVNGGKEGVLREVLASKSIGTTITPDRKMSAAKRRVAHSEGFSKGAAHVNTCAAEVLSGKKAASLLLVGVVKVEGDFEKGDVIEIRDEKNRKIGFGVSQYASSEARSAIGLKKARPLIHYNYMFVD